MSDDRVEIRKGGNAISVSEDSDRIAQVLFIVSQFDLTVDEVKAARAVLEMDSENVREADQQ